IAATALLQNGQAPKYFSEELLNDIFVTDELASSKCVSKLHQGLDTPGIHLFAQKFPMFLYLLRPPQNNTKLTVPLILHLLKPMFSEEGSNSLKYKKAVCSKFVKYLQDVASGRTEQVRSNCWALPNNQAFSLWFPMCLQERPQKTTSGTQKKRITTDCLLKAHTCSNTLHLPRGTPSLPLPGDGELFKLYDHTFKN
ncbi:hypothetical protein pdam_00024220, partial [Pocillopora damicornis]